MSRYRANIEVLLDKEFARNLPFLHGPSHLMANQGPESRLTVCCTFHNDGRGLERDLGANGAEMLASQTVVGQFRNTPSRTVPGQDADQYRGVPAQTAQSVQAAESN